MNGEPFRSHRHDAGHTVLQRFSALAPLSDDERNFLSDQMERHEMFAPRAEIVPEDAASGELRFLLAGWAARTRTLSDGRRQIVDFYLPGDIIGYCTNPDGAGIAPFHALTAVTVAHAARFYHAAHHEAGRFKSFPLICREIERRQEMQLHNQIVRSGRQTAYERLSHLLLEFHARLDAVGLAADNTFSMPLTQEILADGLGLSVVHVNRTMQQLRRERLIALNDGIVALLAPDLLARIADYRPVV